MFQTFLAQAQSAAPQQVPGGGIGSFFIPLIFIFVIMYFVMIRPQKKRQQQQQQLVASLKTGDRVVTNAGIHGLISNVKENTGTGEGSRQRQNRNGEIGRHDGTQRKLIVES